MSAGRISASRRSRRISPRPPRIFGARRICSSPEMSRPTCSMRRVASPSAPSWPWTSVTAREASSRRWPIVFWASCMSAMPSWRRRFTSAVTCWSSIATALWSCPRRSPTCPPKRVTSSCTAARVASWPRWPSSRTRAISRWRISSPGSRRSSGDRRERPARITRPQTTAPRTTSAGEREEDEEGRVGHRATSGGRPGGARRRGTRARRGGRDSPPLIRVWQSAKSYFTGSAGSSRRSVPVMSAAMRPVRVRSRVSRIA